MGIGSILESNSTLNELDITNNRISKDFLMSILKGLKRNSTLTSLKVPELPDSIAHRYLLKTWIGFAEYLVVPHNSITLDPYF